jgi:hypothetical protein
LAYDTTGIAIHSTWDARTLIIDTTESVDWAKGALSSGIVKKGGDIAHTGGRRGGVISTEGVWRTVLTVASGTVNNAILIGRTWCSDTIDPSLTVRSVSLKTRSAL